MNRYKAILMFFSAGLAVLTWLGSRPLSSRELPGIAQPRETRKSLPETLTEAAPLDISGVEIAALFPNRSAPPRRAAAAAPARAPAPDEPIPAPGIKYVGMVMEADVPYYYFRDTTVGKLYKLDTEHLADGVALETLDQETFVMTIEGKKYHVSKK
jgi:hypothetical protein